MIAVTSANRQREKLILPRHHFVNKRVMNE